MRIGPNNEEGIVATTQETLHESLGFTVEERWELRDPNAFVWTIGSELPA